MIHEITHPLVKSLVNHLRSTRMDALRFRHTVAELARLLAHEAFASSPLVKKSIPIWKGEQTFTFMDEEALVFVPILRAGLPMLESAIALFPDASSGFIAMKRDEVSHESVLYYDRLPDCSDKTVIVLDPMIATGGSLCDALELIKSKKPKKIISLNIIASPEGLAAVSDKHSDIELYIAQVDDKLNTDMFILPGLGDAGDRAYNTL